jgi:hypothetical protein
MPLKSARTSLTIENASQMPLTKSLEKIYKGKPITLEIATVNFHFYLFWIVEQFNLWL